MKKVILTFLLTSLFWWILFTYSAYKRSVHDSYIENEPIEQVVTEPDVYPEPVKNDPPKAISATKTRQTKTSVNQNNATSKPMSISTTDVKQKPLEKILTTTTDISIANSSPKRVQTRQQQPETLCNEVEIIGKWQPVEGAEYPLEFTKYGTFIQHRGSYWSRRKYSLNNNICQMGYDDNININIFVENGTTYLEIYNSDDYSGKYKRVSRPENIRYTAINENLYTTAIVGTWTPIDGQEYKIEFSKYGAAIQIRGSYKSRRDYILNGDKLSIAYDNNASIAIWEDSQYLYLEIFNSEDFSGRYKKSK